MVVFSAKRRKEKSNNQLVNQSKLKIEKHKRDNNTGRWCIHEGGNKEFKKCTLLINISSIVTYRDSQSDHVSK